MLQRATFISQTQRYCRVKEAAINSPITHALWCARPPDACKCINTSIRGQISGTGKEIASPVCSPGNIKRGDSLVLQEINSPGILSTRWVLEAYCHSTAVPHGRFKIRGEDGHLGLVSPFYFTSCYKSFYASEVGSLKCGQGEPDRHFLQHESCPLIYVCGSLCNFHQ